MKKILSILSSCAVVCLVSTCGSFNANYTDPSTGAHYYGGVDAPKPPVSPDRFIRDNK